MKRHIFFLLASAGSALGLGGAAAQDARPPFEQLLQLNAAKVFGGDVKLEGDRITIEYKKKEHQFNRGFEGRNLVLPDEVKGDANRAILGSAQKVKEGDKEKDVGPAVVGRGDGDWQSRFELSGDVTLSFWLWMPSIPRDAQFTLSLNRSPKAYIQTNFFQNAVVHGEGRTKGVQAPKPYQEPPERWLGRREGGREKARGKKAKDASQRVSVPVKVSVTGGKYSVKLAGEEVLSIDDASAVPSGRIALSFRKLSFVLSDVTISGKLDRAWCERELKDLETKGDLVLREKPPPAEPPRRSAEQKGEDDKARRLKEAEEEL